MQKFEASQMDSAVASYARNAVMAPLTLSHLSFGWCPVPPLPSGTDICAFPISDDAFALKKRQLARRQMTFDAHVKPSLKHQTNVTDSSSCPEGSGWAQCAGWRGQALGSAGWPGQRHPAQPRRAPTCPRAPFPVPKRV